MTTKVKVFETTAYQRNSFFESKFSFASYGNNLLMFGFTLTAVFVFFSCGLEVYFALCPWQRVECVSSSRSRSED